MARLGARLGHSELYVKREDRTHSVYGGNKVRNLEFVLAHALAGGKRRVVTLVPKGSNFTAALSVHGRAAGLEVRLSQFVALENEQIEAHFRFARRHGARDRTFRGLAGPVLAGAAGLLDGIRRGSDYIVPGASSTLGALGHANAFLELVDQARAGLVPLPDVVVVGAGTCGTVAGLVAGARIAGVPTRLVAVRCAERIVCNRGRIERLARATLTRLGLADARLPEFDLVESPENLGYAIPTRAARGVMDEFGEEEGIILDGTYTSKVGLFLKRELSAAALRGRKVMYWHTFSPAAMPGPGEGEP
jgi:D-cysteine desulfhydrase